jgi:beta-galactosidase/beta-glucuronidase
MTNVEFGFTRERVEAAALQPYLNPLPRSVARSNSFALLDGTWRFDRDPEDRGLTERWYLGREYTGSAQWPGSIERLMSAAHAAQEEAQEEQAPAADDTVVAWYEREFEVPPEWLAAPEGVVQITFGACGYETRAWLNGRPLRTVEGEEVHVGEYTSFSFELPPEHLTAVNRLTVRVADSLDPDTTRGKQESHVYKRGGIWYQMISGPVRSVWIEPVERNRLRSRLGVVSAIEDGLVEFQLTTRVHDPGRYHLRLVVSRPGDDRPLASAEMTLALEAGETRQYLALELADAEPWGPASPALYQLVAQLVGPDGHVSQIQSRFGLRTVEARGRWFYLNGARLYLDGILYQPATATFDEMRRHMAGMRALGCNLVRVHIAGIDPRIYELADEMGMLLWVEVPSPHQPTARSRANHWDELQRLLVQVGAHPSVVILSLYNEDWGAEDIATNPETRAYVTRTYEHLGCTTRSSWSWTTTAGSTSRPRGACGPTCSRCTATRRTSTAGARCSTASRPATTTAWPPGRSSSATPSTSAGRRRSWSASGAASASRCTVGRSSSNPGPTAFAPSSASWAPARSPATCTRRPRAWRERATGCSTRTPASSSSHRDCWPPRRPAEGVGAPSTRATHVRGRIRRAPHRFLCPRR